MIFQYGHRKLKMDFSRITILSVYYISTRCEKAKEGLRKTEQITCNSIIVVTLSSRVKSLPNQLFLLQEVHTIVELLLP